MFLDGKRYLYGAKTARLRRQKQSFSCIKMAFSGRFRAEKNCTKQVSDVYLPSTQRITFAHENCRYLRPDGFNFRISESESVNENQNARPDAETVTIRQPSKTAKEFLLICDILM